MMQWRTVVALAAVVLAYGPTPAAHAGPAGSPEADAAFVAAAKAGDSRTVRTLVRQRVDVNAPEADGTSPLHWAVWSEDVETVTVLLRAGAKVRTANRYGVTPLAVAATNGNAPIIELLLKAGADANTATPEGETALMTAARSGSVAAVRTLLAHGANVNAREGWDQQTALMWAAAENHGDVVGLLVEAGADVNARARVIPGMPERPKGGAVAQQGVHSNFPKGGQTPLLYAVRQNAVSSVRALAKAGVDLDQADPDGFTAVILATLNGHYDLARLLIELGAGLDATDPTGRTPLYAAVDMHTFEYSVQQAYGQALRRDGQRGPGEVSAGTGREAECTSHRQGTTRQVRHPRQSEPDSRHHRLPEGGLDVRRRADAGPARRRRRSVPAQCRPQQRHPRGVRARLAESRKPRVRAGCHQGHRDLPRARTRHRVVQ